ncbi:MAG TPA: TPM domain-containing protein, partial [Candidatus Deferrimicrobiaceae bacterium]
MVFPKVRAASFALLVLLAASAICVAQEPAIPKPAGYVSDTAGIMGEWAARTEKLCGDIERQTAAEVAVLTVKTTAPLDAQQYAQQVFDRWKIGKKGKDNGVLILVAADDRKMWIATGYG